MMDAAERLTLILSRTVQQADGCQVWTGATITGGYGAGPRLGGRRGRGTRLVHRIVYEALVGPIPEGMVLDHLCRNRVCCNPAHLEPVTDGENIRRGVSPSAVNARKTECERGHQFTEENTRYLPSGHRECRVCGREVRRVYRRRRQSPSSPLATEAERRAAKRLGVLAAECQIACKSLWSCSLDEERNRRAATASPVHGASRSRRAHTTRQLLVELGEYFGQRTASRLNI